MPGEEQIYLELGDRRLTLSPGERTVGRSHRCDLVVDERSVSRVHAMISWSGGRLSVQDLNSSNGTYINGDLLRGEADLYDGDEVLLGERLLRVRRVPGTQSERIPVDELTAAVDERFTEHHTSPLSARRPEGPPRSERSSASERKDPSPGGDSEAELALEPRTSVYLPTDLFRVQPETEPLQAVEGVLDAMNESGSNAELLSPIDFGDPLPHQLPVPPTARPIPVPSAAPAPTSTLPSVAPPGLVNPSALPPPAEFLSRLVAGLLDLVFLIALTLMVSYLRGGMVTADGRSLAAGFALLFGSSALVASWVVWGATPGQRIVGLEVCDDRGQSPLTTSRALRRWVGLVVTVVTLGLGFFSMLFHRDELALHDLISRTRVIRKGSI